jgi:hypothetical protein
MDVASADVIGGSGEAFFSSTPANFVWETALAAALQT